MVLQLPKSIADSKEGRPGSNPHYVKMNVVESISKIDVVTIASFVTLPIISMIVIFKDFK